MIETHSTKWTNKFGNQSKSFSVRFRCLNTAHCECLRNGWCKMKMDEKNDESKLYIFNFTALN